jgi:hypothetical protein
VPRVVVCIKSGHAVISGANFGSKVGETIWIKKKKHHLLQLIWEVLRWTHDVVTESRSSSLAPPFSATHIGSIVLNLDSSPVSHRAIQSQHSKLDFPLNKFAILVTSDALLNLRGHPKSTAQAPLPANDSLSQRSKVNHSISYA